MRAVAVGMELGSTRMTAATTAAACAATAAGEGKRLDQLPPRCCEVGGGESGGEGGNGEEGVEDGHERGGHGQ